MTEVQEIAEVLATAYREANPLGGSITGARAYVRQQMREESYNVMDQVELAVDRILWPDVRTQDIPQYF